MIPSHVPREGWGEFCSSQSQGTSCDYTCGLRNPEKGAAGQLTRSGQEEGSCTAVFVKNLFLPALAVGSLPPSTTPFGLGAIEMR